MLTSAGVSWCPRKDANRESMRSVKTNPHHVQSWFNANGSLYLKYIMLEVISFKLPSYVKAHCVFTFPMYKFTTTHQILVVEMVTKPFYLCWIHHYNVQVYRNTPNSCCWNGHKTLLFVLDLSLVVTSVHINEYTWRLKKSLANFSFMCPTLYHIICSPSGLLPKGQAWLWRILCVVP